MEEIDEKLYKKVASISTTIKIIGSPVHESQENILNQNEIDEIDANAFETFTLEEIRSLVLAYKSKNKDFLIARVTTPDPENGSIFYNFYYAAAEINRVLFRFESNRRLLHRMKVKNPLNNMFIVGQVFYFKLTTFEVDRAISEYFYDKNNAKNDIQASYSERPAVGSSESENLKASKSVIGLTTENKIEELKENCSPLPQVPDNKKLTYEAHYFASDDDFLVNSEIRDYFRANALDPEDEFLYEIDRTQNDFMALLEEMSDEEDNEIGDWRRIFSAHISLALSMLVICLLIGGGPIIAVVLLPIALLILGSFILSLCYVLCCRRSTFDTLAVESISDAGSM